MKINESKNASFAFVYFSESGLFNGFTADSNKKNLLSLSLCGLNITNGITLSPASQPPDRGARFSISPTETYTIDLVFPQTNAQKFLGACRTFSASGAMAAAPKYRAFLVGSVNEHSPTFCCRSSSRLGTRRECQKAVAGRRANWRPLCDGAHRLRRPLTLSIKVREEKGAPIKSWRFVVSLSPYTNFCCLFFIALSLKVPDCLRSD